MQSLSPKMKTLGLVGVALLMGWMSACLSFFCIGSSVAVYETPSGIDYGAPYTTVLFALFVLFALLAPLAGVLGALIVTIVTSIVVSFKKLRSNPKIIIVIILASTLVGLFIGLISSVLFTIWAS